MTLSELYTEETEKYIPLKVFKVESRTNFNPDLGEYEEYEVELWGNGETFCNCLAGGYRRKCHHQLEIRDELCEKYGGITQAIEVFRKQKEKENVSKEVSK